MKQDKENPKHWKADEGRCFQSLIDGQIIGNEIVLTTCHRDGEREDDSIDNYIEVDDPNWQPEDATQKCTTATAR